jgi:hypothetical protein
VGGVPLQNLKRGELPTLATCPRVGPETLANPKPTGVGKLGVEGAQPPGRGHGGCAPKNLKEGASCHISSPAMSGTQNAGEPSAYEGGPKGGARGPAAPWQGVWGMCPHETLKGDELPTLATSPRVGPKTPASPRPTGVGQGGSRGRGPLAGGLGDVPPRNFERGRVAHISNPATSGTQNASEPSANGGGPRGVQGAQALTPKVISSLAPKLQFCLISKLCYTFNVKPSPGRGQCEL